METKLTDTTENRQGPEKKESKGRILWLLFFTMFKINCVTFGGGFVIIQFMEHYFLTRLKWLDEQEMMDYAALGQSAPGPIAINVSMLIGWKKAGFWGMAAATAGAVTPPLIILSIISLCYTAFASNPYVAMVLHGMQAGVAAIILNVAVNMGDKIVRSKTRSILQIVLMVLAFVLVFFLKVSAMYVVVGALILGILYAVIGQKGAKA